MLFRSMAKSQLSLKELKRASKSFEAIQQSVFIAILNISGYALRIKKPDRQAQKTIQCVGIESAVNVITKEEVMLNNIILAQCDEITQNELVSMNSQLTLTDITDPKNSNPEVKTIKRHREANKSALFMKKLIDMCKDCGCEFVMKNTKQARLTVQMPKITALTFIEKTLGKTEIMDLGKRVNELLSSLLTKNKIKNVVLLDACNRDIMKAWTECSDKVKVKTSVIPEPTVHQPSCISEPAISYNSTLFQDTNEMAQPQIYSSYPMAPYQPVQQVVYDTGCIQGIPPTLVNYYYANDDQLQPEPDSPSGFINMPFQP